MNTYEIIRFVPFYSEPPVEYVLKTEEDENEQKLYLCEETKSYSPMDACCGQYCIHYNASNRIDYPNPSLRDQLKNLLERKDIERQLGDLNRLNNEYKAMIAGIMDEIKGK